MSRAIRFTHVRQPGGSWTALVPALEFGTGQEASAYRLRSWPTEYLASYADMSASRSTTETDVVAPPSLWTQNPAPAAPTLSFANLAPTVWASAPEPNAPRLTSAGAELATTVRSEAVKVSSGRNGRDPVLDMTRGPAITTPVPSVIPPGRTNDLPRLMTYSEATAPPPAAPPLYSVNPTWPGRTDIVSTAPEPDPPRLYKALEWFPIDSAPEPNPPRVTYTPPDTSSWPTYVPGPPATSAEPNPPRFAKPEPSPALAATPPPSTKTLWDEAFERFGQWWTKPSIWPTVEKELGRLPAIPAEFQTPAPAPSAPEPIPPPRPPPGPVLGSLPNTPPDLPTMPTSPSQTTPTATESGNQLDEYLSSLDGVVKTVGNILDAIRPGAGATAAPPTATPQPAGSKASPSFGADVPPLVWGGIGILLLLLLGKRR